MKTYLTKEDKARLKKRYLLWLFKTTKEQLDRINRKYTQLEIDRQVYQRLQKASKNLAVSRRAAFKDLLGKFSGYIKEKESSVLFRTGGRGKANAQEAEYIFLIFKMQAIEQVIRSSFGHRFLKEISADYQHEMVKRILEERWQGKV